MPVPTNPAEFLDLVRKSALIPEERLQQFLQGRTLPEHLRDLSELFVAEKLLTSFQADQLLLGKFRGFTVGSYVVLRPLGAGGMASVYLCHHKDLLERFVAIKVLPKAKADDSVVLKRFRREGRAICALDHPNIVHAYEIDQDEKLHFMVMEYVEGTNLFELVDKHGALPIPTAVDYIRQATRGLQHIHDKGLIHRDIKPANLLLSKDGVIKLFDMGLARFFEDEVDVLTKGVLGTADYIAPEQTYDSHKVDSRADIYSLGSSFYYLLTGKIPFGKGTVWRKIEYHRSSQPQPIHELRAEVPADLEAIVSQMMAKDPAHRQQTAMEVHDALLPWVTEQV
ncbi:MAG: serine/threonine-protein kinase [Gemmataceae bacterium]